MNKQEQKKLEQRVQKTLKTHIKKNSKIVLGLSGGPDSIFLLHHLLILQKMRPFQLFCVHINHKLRVESDKEEQLLINTFKTTSSPLIKLITKQIKIKEKANKEKKGLEETGRKYRYQTFKKVAKKYNCNLILTAHHADDNLETILLNLARGASLKGLCGIETTSPLTKNITLFRPLLNISKSEIEKYLKPNLIPYVIDQSNNDESFNRNLVRLKVVPNLKRINPSLTSTIASNTTNLREIQHFLNKKAGEWITRNTLNKTKTSFNLKQLQKTHPALKKAILRNLYHLHKGSTKNLENIHLDEILRIIDQNIGNKTKKIGKLQFSINQGKIKVSVAK